MVFFDSVVKQLKNVRPIIVLTVGADAQITHNVKHNAYFLGLHAYLEAPAMQVRKHRLLEVCCSEN